jgi:tRNA dimethylallyltransferase
MKSVIVITGPTAVGKTNISIELAKHFNGEIINADASQMRKYLNVGTAKITADEMDNVPHHLIDFLDPNDDFSIKDFQTKGRQIIDNIEIPFIVGGSGLYIQSLITDYQLDDKPRKEEEFYDISNEELYNILIELDPITANKTHPNNRRRVLRYIEIARQSGNAIPKTPDNLFNALIICLTRDRKTLYDNINRRCLYMLENGWIEECINLKEMGYDLMKIKDIGYQDINQYLNDEISFDDLVNIISQKQRRYAKRQMTWFRNKMNCTFIDLEKDEKAVLYNLIEEHLKANS